MLGTGRKSGQGALDHKRGLLVRLLERDGARDVAHEHSLGRYSEQREHWRLLREGRAHTRACVQSHTQHYLPNGQGSSAKEKTRGASVDSDNFVSVSKDKRISWRRSLRMKDKKSVHCICFLHSQCRYGAQTTLSVSNVTGIQEYSVKVWILRSAAARLRLQLNHSVVAMHMSSVSRGVQGEPRRYETHFEGENNIASLLRPSCVQVFVQGSLRRLETHNEG